MIMVGVRVKVRVGVGVRVRVIRVSFAHTVSCSTRRASCERSSVLPICAATCRDGKGYDEDCLSSLKKRVPCPCLCLYSLFLPYLFLDTSHSSSLKPLFLYEPLLAS
jgi:hypothetical protein